ncbi:universal stress protein [bacterium]|nr:universal stress protein [bacterium]
MFRKILVATDFSKPSRAALLAAISLAEHGSGRVETLHVSTLGEYPFGSSPFVVATSSLQADLRGKLEDFFPQRVYPNSDRHLILGASISDEIQNFARKNGFDLIVLGSHGRGPVGRLFLGSVVQKVTHDSQIPVMVVRDFEHANERYHGFDRILIPTDFSDTSYKALTLGVEFANFLKADLHYIHVIDLPTVTDLNSVYPFLNMTIPPIAGTDVNLTLQKDLKNHYLVGNQKVATLIGDPVREILSYSEEHHIGFIVMGTHGRKGLERVLMGSVTAGIVARSKIPVITVSVSQLAQ